MSLGMVAERSDRGCHVEARCRRLIAVAVAVAAGIAIVTIYRQWSRAETEHERADTADREREKDRLARQELTNLRLLVRAQAEVVNTWNEADTRVAVDRWRSLRATIPSDSMAAETFVEMNKFADAASVGIEIERHAPMGRAKR